MVERVAFLNTHPIQYKAPLYAYLNSDPDFEITALYMSDFSVRGAHDAGFETDVAWDLDLLAGYRAIMLGDAARSRKLGGFFSMLAPELWGAIHNGRFDALVIHGHNYAAHHLGLAAARATDTPVFMRCETQLSLKRTPAKAALRGPLLRQYYRAFSGFLAIGCANRAFYKAMGASDEKIFLVPYAVDNDRFAAMSALTPVERIAERTLLGVPDNRPVVLFSGKFQPRKHPDDLMRACALLGERGLPLHLLMVGSGELEAELRGLASQLPHASVSFPGFINQTRLPRIYAASDVFVLPSSNEPWGLAINEAMACGLPIVASSEIGAVADLVVDGVNGATFQARDIAGLAQAIEHVISDPVRRRAMSQASRNIISSWSYSQCRDGLHKALAHTGRGKRT